MWTKPYYGLSYYKRGCLTATLEQGQNVHLGRISVGFQFFQIVGKDLDALKTVLQAIVDTRCTGFANTPSDTKQRIEAIRQIFQQIPRQYAAGAVLMAVE